MTGVVKPKSIFINNRRQKIGPTIRLEAWVSKHCKQQTREGKTNPEVLVEQKHHLTGVRMTSPSSIASGGAAAAPTPPEVAAGGVVGKRWYSSGAAKGGRDGVAKDTGGRSDCRIFWAAGGLPLPTPDMRLLIPSRPGRRPRISRDRA